MIRYSTNDRNLDLIHTISQTMDAIEMKYRYYVYGLRQEGRPPLRISPGIPSGTTIIPNESTKTSLNSLMLRNGIGVVFDATPFRDEDRKTISIGLRLDVRSYPPFAAALLQTIILAIEGRIVLDDKFTIPGLSKVFKRTVTTFFMAGTKVKYQPKAFRANSCGALPPLCKQHHGVIQAVAYQANGTPFYRLKCSCGMNWNVLQPLVEVI